MADGQGSFMFMVPSMLNQVVRHPLAKTLTYPALKVIQIGGAPIADETALMGREVFGDVLYQGFGQTEAVPVCMMGPSEWFSSVGGLSRFVRQVESSLMLIWRSATKISQSANCRSVMRVRLPFVAMGRCWVWTTMMPRLNG